MAAMLLLTTVLAALHTTVNACPHFIQELVRSRHLTVLSGVVDKDGVITNLFLEEMIVVGGARLRESVCLRLKYSFELRTTQLNSVCMFLQFMSLSRTNVCHFYKKTAVLHHPPTVNYFKVLDNIVVNMHTYYTEPTAILNTTNSCWESLGKNYKRPYGPPPPPPTTVQFCRMKNEKPYPPLCTDMCLHKMDLIPELTRIIPGSEPFDWFLTRASIFRGRIESMELNMKYYVQQHTKLKNLQLERTHLQRLLVHGPLSRYQDIARINETPSLVALSLIDSALTNLQVNFSMLPNLTQLSVTNNSLTELPIGIGMAKNLQYLDLSNNYLSNLGTELLSLNHLSHLNLSKNIFHNIPREIEFISLKDLSLSYNQINDVVFKLHPGLLHLRLDHNNLTDFQGELLSGLKNLRTLDISHNNIINISSQIFNKMYNLVSLNMSSVPLLNLDFLQPKSEFPSLQPLRRLEQLLLRGCGLKFLDTKYFQYLHLLKVLDLSFNPLHKIPSNLITGLNKLNSLYISNIYLESGPGLNLGKRNLKYLDMSYNRIFMPTDIIINGYVDYLDIGYNNITEWNDPQLFCKRDQYCIGHLDVSKNGIEVLSAVMLDSLDILLEVDLRENPFNCKDCLLYGFRDWLLHKAKTKLSSENLICASPTSVIGKHIIMITDGEIECFEHKKPKSPTYTSSTLVIFLLIAAITVILIGYKFRFYVIYAFHMMGIRWQPRATDKRTYQYDAFICYCGSDRDWVLNELEPKLENGPEQFRLCLHDRDFPLGSSILQNIESSIHKSRHIVIIVSPDFILSQWCSVELELTNHAVLVEDHNRIVIIQMEPLESQNIPRHLRFLMDTYTYLEWPNDEDEIETAWKRLRKEDLGESLFQQCADIPNKEDRDSNSEEFTVLE